MDGVVHFLNLYSYNPLMYHEESGECIKLASTFRNYEDYEHNNQYALFKNGEYAENYGETVIDFIRTEKKRRWIPNPYWQGNIDLFKFDKYYRAFFGTTAWNNTMLSELKTLWNNMSADYAGDISKDARSKFVSLKKFYF